MSDVENFIKEDATSGRGALYMGGTMGTLAATLSFFTLTLPVSAAVGAAVAIVAAVYYHGIVNSRYHEQLGKPYQAPWMQGATLIQREPSPYWVTTKTGAAFEKAGRRTGALIGAAAAFYLSWRYGVYNDHNAFSLTEQIFNSLVTAGMGGVAGHQAGSLAGTFLSPVGHAVVALRRKPS